MGHAVPMGAASYDEIVAANLRAARARAGLDQAVVVERMRALGYTTWHRQTMGKVERGERRLLVAEVMALAWVLDTNLPALMSTASGDGEVRFPAGDAISARSIALLALAHNDRSVTWEDTKPTFTPDKGEITVQVAVRPRSLFTAQSLPDPAIGEGRAPLPETEER